MDLFEQQRSKQTAGEAPLAARMRPRSFGEFVGQEHLVAPDRVLRKAIEADQVPSMLLWGPPGSGKTTLAFLIASLTRSHFEPVSAVTSGVADLRRIVEEARERRALYGQRTILFVDEIHRFNKAQQDVILPHVEQGVVTFIGATTENPSFEVVSPLLSRSQVFSLEPLTPEQVRAIVDGALEDTERGLGGMKVEAAPEAVGFLVEIAGGDARVALNALELAVTATPPGPDGVRRIPVDTVADALQKPALLYDKAGDHHYDTISAFIKSVRGSDPDAAVYWLTRMIEAGEDPLFIARRLVILSAEDIGLADPQALPVSVAAYQAVHFIGFPEGAIPLAEATVYLATAPKSNTAYAALNRAREEVKKSRHLPVPLHLRNPVTSLMKQKGYGKGYKYAHDFPGHFVDQDFLPQSLKGRRFYYPAEQGYEKEISQRLQQWWREKKPGAGPPGESV